MRGTVLLAVAVLVGGSARAGELFDDGSWDTVPPVTGKVLFNGTDWVITAGGRVDGAWLHGIDLLGYAEQLTLGNNDGQGNLIPKVSVAPAEPPTDGGWTHYDLSEKHLLVNEHPDGHVVFDGGVAMLLGLHDGYFSKVQGLDVPGLSNNATLVHAPGSLPPAEDAGGHVVVKLTWETLDPPYGDANVDGRIDLGDFGLLKANFETFGHEPFTNGDLTGNGQVTLNDFALLKQNFGWRAPPVAAPEPTALLLFGVGIAGVLLAAFCSGRAH